MSFKQYDFSLITRDGMRKYLNLEERKRFAKTTHTCELCIKLFCLLHFWTGARISEILNLKVSHFDFSCHTVQIMCLKKRKLGIFRQIPLPDSLFNLLKEHINQRHLSQCNTIFTWSRRTASRKIKAVMNISSIQGPQACAKGLRHSFALACIDKNIPITLIQKWLGHSSLKTTAIYLNIVGKEEKSFAKRLWVNSFS